MSFFEKFVSRKPLEIFYPNFFQKTNKCTGQVNMAFKLHLASALIDYLQYSKFYRKNFKKIFAQNFHIFDIYEDLHRNI